MSKYIHQLRREGDLERIQSSGFLRAPVYVFLDSVPIGTWGCGTYLELDLRGCKLYKDRDSKALEGYYYTKKDIPVSRITRIEHHNREWELDQWTQYLHRVG